jgi:hypothetical protein
MRLTVSARDRRALILGAVAAVALLGFNFAVRPGVAKIRQLSDTLDEERALLVRELELLAATPAYADGVEAGGERLLAAAPRLFGGDTDGLASAYLAEYVQEAAGSRRTLITRLDPGGSEPVGAGLESVSAVVHGESDLEGLLTLLYVLECGEKLVQVSDLRIQTARANPTLPPPMEVISFEMRVTGFQLLPFDPDDGQPEVTGVEVES